MEESRVGLSRMLLDYYHADIERAYETARMLANSPEPVDFRVRIRAGIIISMYAMHAGDAKLWLDGRAVIAQTPCLSQAERDERDFWLAGNDSALYDCTSFPQWLQRGEYSRLPREIYPWARVYYAKYLYIKASNLLSGREEGEWRAFLNVLPCALEPLISETQADGAFIEEIYLRLICAIACQALGDDERAIYHVDKAIAMALSKKLYMILAEYQSGLATLMQTRLMQADREAARKVMALYKRLNDGWEKLYNALLDRRAFGRLTLRERESARLAAMGLTNREIAIRLNISPNTVKDLIASALTKTGETGRSGLKRHI